ncbi:MAG: shikimate kinase AroK [Halieaceae bacterium]|jgi:shikimate kinase|nr:shikimate kinase AroK [Halieaceae bacterium]
MNLPSRLFLVGPMGAGKTTVGRRLASLMGREFIDIDQEIERRAGADIPWIFDVEGESGFRDREQAVLADLAERSSVVLATGGGAVLREANRRVMAAAGAVVYLHATVREQVKRTRRDSRRPLLAGGNREQVLSDLMTIRDPLYREVADIVVDAGGNAPGQMAEQIYQRLLS